MYKPKIGITVGDINGIGLEVIIKFLSNSKILEKSIPIIYGSTKVFSYHKNIVGSPDIYYQQIANADQAITEKVNILKCWNENVNITLGEINETGGKYAYISLDRAFSDLQKGEIDAVVTAPIHKKAMQLAGFQFPGHTEYITNMYKDYESLMLMINDDLRIGTFTNHVSIEQAYDLITEDLIIEKTQILNDSLKKDFGIEKPLIAILALDPHAGDEGVIGTKDNDIVRPAILKMKEKGLHVFGPFPADGFFGSGSYKKFEGVIAMYHDQGLVPFKLLSYGNGVNFTAGLPIIRTSVDHGTGFDIVGKNTADMGSLQKAYFLALDIYKSRVRFEEIHASKPIYNTARNSPEK